MQKPRQAVHQEVPAWLSAALVCGTLAAILTARLLQPFYPRTSATSDTPEA